MKRQLIVLFVISLAAEIGASLWLWLRAPTDTVSVWFDNFWSYEAVRFIPWVVIFTVLAATYLLWTRKAK